MCEFKTNCFIFQGFQEGSANKMYCYHLKSDDVKSDAIIFRLYQASKASVTDCIDKDAMCMQIAHAAGVAQEVHAIFQNGMACQYAQGRTITFDDLSKPHIIKYVTNALYQIFTYTYMHGLHPHEPV